MTDKEQDRIENFKLGHVCPDRDIHDGISFSTQVLYSSCGIGSNTYIKCNRCHAWQDVTDYGSW